MKFIDAPASVREELAARRRRFNPDAEPPASGNLWYFGATGCAVCGRTGTHQANGIDHCNITGLERGVLCHGCNVAEGKSTKGDLWPFWRRHAPLLANRTIHPRNPYCDPNPVYPAPLALTLEVGVMLDAFDWACESICGRRFNSTTAARLHGAPVCALVDASIERLSPTKQSEPAA